MEATDCPYFGAHFCANYPGSTVHDYVKTITTISGGSRISRGGGGVDLVGGGVDS